MKERCQNLERAIADASIEKTDLKELYEKGSEINEELRGNIKELEIERRDLMYDLHVAKAQIALGLPQKLGVGKIVVVGDGHFKLEEGVSVDLSDYFSDILGANVVPIDRLTYLEEKQRVIQGTLKNAKFVVEVGLPGSHIVKDLAGTIGVTHDNGRYISVRGKNQEAISEAISKIVETEKQEIKKQKLYAQE